VYLPPVNLAEADSFAQKFNETSPVTVTGVNVVAGETGLFVNVKVQVAAEQVASIFVKHLPYNNAVVPILDGVKWTINWFYFLEFSSGDNTMDKVVVALTYNFIPTPE